jgi:hypothetical protein
MEVVRDGQVVSETKEVHVAAGAAAQVRFDGSGPIAPVAARTEGPPEVRRPERQRAETAVKR